MGNHQKNNCDTYKNTFEVIERMDDMPPKTLSKKMKTVKKKYKTEIKDTNMRYRTIQRKYHVLNPNYNEIIMIITTLDPFVICLHVTFLKKKKIILILETINNISTFATME